MTDAADLAKAMPDIARKFWGEPNERHSTKQQLRWGNNGARAVDIGKGTWFDHEAKQGGGVIDLLKREHIAEPWDWLREHGYAEAGNNGGNRRRRIVATYDYTDETGALLFQVCRLDPKDFRQRRPARPDDPPDKVSDGWVWNVKGVRQVPYRLPELIEAIALDHPVFVVEGEKDCHTLARHGITATTNAMGAGKWNANLVEHFSGADVIVIPDNDDAGRKHANEVARSLAGSAARIRRLDLPGLPDKGDVSDWFSSGTVEAFNALTDAAPDWNDDGSTEPNALGEWDAGDDTEPPPPRGWLLGNTFARQFLSSLLGDGGVGKTALRYAQALSLACGRSLTGEHVFQRSRVLIISLEDDADELRRRILAVRLHFNIARDEIAGWLFLAAPGAAVGKLATTDPHGNIKRGALADHIESVIVARKIDLVMIDPFVKAHSVEENLNSAIDEVAQLLTNIAAKHDIAIDAPHHTSKGTADPGNAQRGRGASAMINAARLVYTLSPMSSEEAKTFSIAEDQRRQFIRVDPGKVNIAKAAGAATWFRLVGVRLDNGTTTYPNGDEVQTVEPWQPPGMWAYLTGDLLNQMLSAIDAGTGDGNFYTDAATAPGREAWTVVQRFATTKSEKHCREI